MRRVSPPPSARPPARRRPRHRALRIVGRVGYTLVLQIVCLSLAAIVVIYHGPFTKLRDTIVLQAMGTNSQQYWATAFLSADEVNAILERAQPKLTDATQDTSSIQIASPPASPPAPSSSSSSKRVNPLSGVTVTTVTGNGYQGKLMAISDPSRVTLAVSPNLGHSGSRLSTIVTGEGAVGGINAGGFLDDNFIQNGGLPGGIVISNGTIVSQQKGQTSFDIIGFNTKNVLIVARSMTPAQIKQANLRCGVSFGPPLVVNGKSLVVSGGTNLEPRTAIGQRKDGTVLLLVIDGRQSSSAGVTYQTIATIMLKNGAYNAANLDGGSSTTMYWNGSVINSPSDLLGERSIPTAFVVMPAS